jgi:GT2 family glycosyltransferase
VVDLPADRLDLDRFPTEDLVTFVTDGDAHQPQLLFMLAATDSEVDLVSWDDVLDVDGHLHHPRVRPRWSPDTHLAVPYLQRAFAVRVGAVAETGWRLDGDMDPTVDLWRLVDLMNPDPARTVHLPWFLSRSATRRDRLAPEVVGDALARRGIAAHLGPEGRRLAFDPSDPRCRPTVTIVVPTRHNRPHLAPLFARLEATAHDGVELVVIDNSGYAADKASWYSDQPFADRTTVEWWTRPFNWSAVNNHGASLGTGEVLVFCNDDALPLRGDWLVDLCGWLTVPGVGSVGPLMVGSDGSVTQAGISVGLAGFCEHLLRGSEPRGTELIGPVGWPRDVFAMAGTCVAVRRPTFEIVGGFDEDYELTCSDVAFGIAIGRAGLRNVCTGLTSIRHDERTTRGDLDLDDDRLRLGEELEHLMDDDPVLTRQLSRWSTRTRLATTAERAERRRGDRRPSSVVGVAGPPGC